MFPRRCHSRGTTPPLSPEKVLSLHCGVGALSTGGEISSEQEDFGKVEVERGGTKGTLFNAFKSSTEEIMFNHEGMLINC